MSQYISMRFKGVVIEALREEIFNIFLVKDWRVSKESIFEYIKSSTGEEPKVPFKDLVLPTEWVESTLDGQSFQNSMDKVTGVWVFTFTTHRIDEFKALMYEVLPFIIEHVEVCEVWRNDPYSLSRNRKDSKITRYMLEDNRWHVIG